MAGVPSGPPASPKVRHHQNAMEMTNSEPLCGKEQSASGQVSRCGTATHIQNRSFLRSEAMLSQAVKHVGFPKITPGGREVAPGWKPEASPDTEWLASCATLTTVTVDLESLNGQRVPLHPVCVKVP